jgi:hypothetical protein
MRSFAPAVPDEGEEVSVSSDAWELFDKVIASAELRDVNPWAHHHPGPNENASSAAAAPKGTGPSGLSYQPDYETLTKLLGIPLLLNAPSQSGVPALALDVWVAYEFRRAGFETDAIWPRPTHPRVLSPDIAALLTALPRDLRGTVTRRLSTGGLGGAASSNANLLGKNYVKQVDVGMSSWRTGPELLVSTKRMDSSFAKNAANRVEESYGDAKNLRSRHPRAALGFVYGLRSTALTTEPDKTEWLTDLLVKLGREEDAYDAVALVIPEWGSDSSSAGADPADETEPDDENAFVAAGLEPAATTGGSGDPEVRDAGLAAADTKAPPGGDHLPLAPDSDPRLDSLPAVRLRHDAIPAELSPARFFEVMIGKILDNCPINFHREARENLRTPVRGDHN